MLSVLLSVLIMCLIAGVIFWILTAILAAFGIGQPWINIVRAIFGLIVLIWLIEILVGGWAFPIGHGVLR